MSGAERMERISGMTGYVCPRVVIQVMRSMRSRTRPRRQSVQSEQDPPRGALIESGDLE